MTTLVGILGGDKNLKRVFNRILLPVIICFFFLSLVPNAVAQSPTEQAEAREAALGGREAAEREGRAAAARAAAAAIPVIGASGPLTPAQQAAIDAATGYDPASDAAARAQMAENAMLAENMGSTPDGVLGFFHTYVLTGIGWVVGMAGSAFDYAITNYIIGFGSLYITGTGETIDELWSTVRDIFNLTFIFGLVYIGFKMILDSSDSSARKMLVSLIGAALLVNFSLFITKFVVDFSNIAAAQIFNAFEGTGSGPLSITNGFMKMMGIQSLIGVEYSAGGSFAYIIGMLLIFAVLAYVFLAGAIMIIIRFVVLNIYMVFSPFMFLGWVFPALQSYSRDYWSGFLRQAFFAPAFLFMLYLSYRVASTFPTQRDLGHMFNPNGSSVVEAPALIPYFALVIVFLCASMVVAKKMGAHGASAAVAVGHKLRGSAQGFMYRNTGGRLSKGALNFMNRSGMSNLPGTRALRSGLKSGYEYGAGGTSLAKTRSDIESEQADITKNRSKMQGLKDTKLGKKQVATAANNSAELATLRGLPYAGLSPDQKLRLTELESDQAKADKFITGLDKSEIEALTPVERAKYSTRFSADQVSKIMESDKISTVEKNKVFGARVDSISAKIGGATPTAAKVTKLSRDELDTLGFDWAAKNSHMLTQTQFDDYVKNSKKITPEIAESLKNRRENELLVQIQGGTPQANNILKELAKKPAEFVQLPTKVFTTAKSATVNYDAIIPYLTTGIMEELAKGKLDQTQRFAMKTYLSKPGKGTTLEVLGYLASKEGEKKYGL